VRALAAASILAGRAPRPDDRRRWRTHGLDLQSSPRSLIGTPAGPHGALLDHGYVRGCGSVRCRSDSDCSHVRTCQAPISWRCRTLPEQVQAITIPAPLPGTPGPGDHLGQPVPVVEDPQPSLQPPKLCFDLRNVVTLAGEIMNRPQPGGTVRVRAPYWGCHPRWVPLTARFGVE